MSIPVISKPNRTVFVELSPDPSRPNIAQEGAPFSPKSFIPRGQSGESPVISSVLTPRPPIVHFFVCDYGNAKVKMVADQFVDMLVANGAMVYTEKYATHQPGYQVRASSLNSPADFFFQIHSKTAGPGHVRLLLGGQPKRMTLEESIADLWSLWKLKSGGLSKEECECLSGEKISIALEEFAGISRQALSIDQLQIDIRNGSQPSRSITQIDEMKQVLLAGKSKLGDFKPMSTDWAREPGSQLSRCVSVPMIKGLSQPMKTALSSVIDNTIEKLDSLKVIAEKMKTEASANQQKEGVEDNPQHEIEIPVTQRDDSTNWGSMIGSIDDDYGSRRLSSMGDSDNGMGSMGHMLEHSSFLDDI